MFSYSNKTVCGALYVQDLWFRYQNSGDWVLRGVDLCVEPGNVVLVLGASGSGKTTLLRAVSGIGSLVYGADMRGRVLIGGKTLESLSIDEIRRSIQVVNQNLYTHFVEYVVGTDLYNTAVSIHGQNVGEKIFRKVVTMLGLGTLLKRKFFELSGGQLRRVAIAKAMLWDPRVVVLDEPLMWLDDEGLSDVRGTISVLRSIGKAVVVFEHRFLGLLHASDEIYVLNAGKLVRVKHEDLRPRGSIPVTRTAPAQNIRREDVDGSAESISANSLWFRYDGESPWILSGVNLRVGSPGDYVVIYGRNGSGKSTLLKLLAGHLSPTKGSIVRRSKVIYLPQNIYLFFTEESIVREFEVTCSAHGMGTECVERGIRRLRTMGVNVELDRSPFNLSWGQAIRVAISIATSLGDNVVLLLDEPFTGLTYPDRLSLAQLLGGARTSKIMTVSSRETLTILPTARVYELSDGILTRIEAYPDPEVLAVAERFRSLGLSGVM